MKKTITGCGEYLSPECSCFEMKCGQVLCSSGNLHDMQDDDLYLENLDA